MRAHPPFRFGALVQTLLLSVLVSCAQGARSAAPGSEELKDPLPDFRREAVSTHIRALADDRVEGRATGTTGHRQAAGYVAGQLRSLGIEALGDNGTFFQEVPLRLARLESATLEVALGKGQRRVLEHERDFVVTPDFARGEYRAEAPLVFLGYGVQAEEYRYDDLDGANVRGKVAVVLDGAPLGQKPDFFPALPSAVASDRLDKLEALAKRGAVGVVMVRIPRAERLTAWSRVVQGVRFQDMIWTDGSQLPRGRPFPRFTVPGHVFDELLAAAGRPERVVDLVSAAEAGSPRTFDLGMTARLSVRSPSTPQSSPNVVGRWAADSSSPAAGEALIFSAHLDHLGIGDPVNGDRIYNGAGDDAAGCSMVLEIARAFTHLGFRPQRSVLFVFFTGEEKGLLGSDYFAAHPPVPIDRVVAAINSDFAAYPILPLRALEPLGIEHSTLEADVRRAAQATGVTVWPDSKPEETRFIRSDHYSLVRLGVPGIYPMVGLAGATAAQREAVAAFERVRYHQPADEWEPTRDYQPLADFARFQFLVGLSVAQRADRPAWKQGDYFQRFSRSGSSSQPPTN
jgi:hypothetical protein